MRIGHITRNTYFESKAPPAPEAHTSAQWSSCVGVDVGLTSTDSQGLSEQWLRARRQGQAFWNGKTRRLLQKRSFPLQRSPWMPKITFQMIR